MRDLPEHGVGGEKTRPGFLEFVEVGAQFGDDTHAGAVGELVHLALVSPLLDGQRDQHGENDHQRLERELRQPGQ